MAKNGTQARGGAVQRSEIAKLARRLKQGKLLDLRREKGAFHLDKYANQYCSGNFGLLRREVERHARIAVVRSIQDIKDYPDTLEQAAKFLLSVERLKLAARPLLISDSRILDIALGLQHKNRSSLKVPAMAPASQVVSHLTPLLEWIDELQSHYSVKPPKANHTEFLVKHFVDVMSRFYRNQTDKNVPRSRGGPFVRFLQDVWADLEFPELPDFTIAYIPKLTA